MTDVTDDMVQAFAEAIDLWVGAGKEAGTTRADMYRYAITAALAVAPAAGGSVWCEHFHDVVLTLHGTGCPGPHRSLLLGPEVQA